MTDNRKKKSAILLKFKNFLLKNKLECFVLLITILTYMTFLSRVYTTDIALMGDSYYYYKIMISMVEDFDIEVSNNIFDDIYQYEYDIFYSPFSLGKNGKIYPKHPVLVSFLAIPFYLLFRGSNNGMTALLIFVASTVLILYLLIYIYIREYYDTKTSIITFLLLLYSTPMIKETGFGSDLIIAIFIFGGLYCLEKNRPSLGGLMLGFSVIGRVTSLLFIFLLPILLLREKTKKNIIKALPFILIPLIIFGIFNYCYFGSPFTTGYDRTLCYKGGKVTIESHKNLYSKNLFDGFKRIFIQGEKVNKTFTEAHIFDPFPAQFPIWWFLIPGLILFSRKDRYLTIYIVTSFIIIIIFYGRYDIFQNRYIYPWLCFFCIPIASFIDWILKNASDT